MRKIQIRENVAVFLVFFGIALFEAAEQANWVMVLFWLMIGTFFLRADNLRGKRLNKGVQ